jgi:hypothetical protein
MLHRERPINPMREDLAFVLFLFLVVALFHTVCRGIDAALRWIGI